MSAGLRELLRQVFGMAQQGCESPAAAYRWCERIDEVLHEGRASQEYADYAVDLPPVLDALLAPSACWCRTCRPITLDDMRFVVCPDCGNKRCPKANHHNHACTCSNEPGQPGSAYE